MFDSTEGVVRQLQEAFASGDYSPVTPLLDERIIYHIPGNNPFSGEHRGITGVLALYARGSAYLSHNACSITPLHVSSSAAHVVTRTLRQALVNGLPVQWHQNTLFFFKDGRVTHCWVYVDNLNAYDAFWSSGESPSAGKRLRTSAGSA